MALDDGHSGVRRGAELSAAARGPFAAREQSSGDCGGEVPSYSPMDVLAVGANFEMVASDAIVRCVVVNRPDIDAEEGARCAKRMHDVLISKVLVRDSSYVGLIFDVRRGPDVFGPKTRAALEELFRTAEISGKRLALRLGDAAIQRLQFGSLCRDCAPLTSKIVETDLDAHHWLRGGGG